MANKFSRVIGSIYRFAIIYSYNTIVRKIQKTRLSSKIYSTSPPNDFLIINSENERKIQIEEEDINLGNVIFSCYFIHKENPQTGEVQNKANFDYIKDWYNCVKELNIDSIIIHDGIDADFISTYSTEKIKFRKFEAGNHPLVDERWIFFYNFLLKTNIKKVFYTDIGDVILTKNPFDLISEKNQLFIGRDNANKIYLSQWILNEIKAFQSETKIKIPNSFYYQPLYNVGIVGGNSEVMKFVLSEVVSLILQSSPTTYKEMTIFNYVIHNNFFPYLRIKKNDSILVDPKNDKDSTHQHLVSGYPFNSGFKKFELTSDAYFIHK